MKPKRFLLLGLCLTLVMNIMMPSISSAQSSTSAQSSSSAQSSIATENGIDLKMTGKDSWEYFEEKDGETYKVVEKLIDETSVQSFIYKQNGNGKYVQQSELHTTLKNDKELVTKELKNGKVTVKTEDMSDYVKTVEPGNTINEELGEWVHLRTKYGSRSVGDTVGAISIVLALFIPKTAGALVSLASLVYASQAPRVYYRQNIYYKYLVGTTIPGAEMYSTSLFEDSNRTQYIGRDTYINYVD